MANTIQIKRGIFTSLPILLSGELGFSTDSKRVHIGDGTSNHEILMHNLFNAQTIIAATTDNTPVSLTVTEQTFVGRKTGANIAALSVAESLAILDVESGADVTDSTNVNTAGAVMETDFNATSFLYASDVSTPINKTAAEVMGLLSGSATADFTMNTHKITGVVDPSSAQDVATKNYVDGIMGANDAMSYQGATDCSLNPNYPAGDAGDTYKVSVAGKIGGASGSVVEVGDMFICITDATVTGDQATVGANWTVIQVNIDGAVVGPASAIDDMIATFNGISGTLIQDGGVALATLFNKTNDDTDNISIGAAKFVTAADLTLLGNLSGTNSGDEVVASGAEVITGTDNTKMITALAMENSDFLRSGDATYYDDADVQLYLSGGTGIDMSAGGVFSIDSTVATESFVSGGYMTIGVTIDGGAFA